MKEFAREVWQEFIGQPAECSFQRDGKAPGKCKRGATVVRWIVDIRDAASCKVAEDVGVVWSPGAVIPLAPECRRDCI